MGLTRIVSRTLLAGLIVREGVGILMKPGKTAEKAAPVVRTIAEKSGLPDDPHVYARGAGAALVASGALIGVSRGKLGQTAGLAASAVLMDLTVLELPIFGATHGGDNTGKKSGKKRKRSKGENRGSRRDIFFFVALIAASLGVAADSTVATRAKLKKHAQAEARAMKAA